MEKLNQILKPTPRRLAFPKRQLFISSSFTDLKNVRSKILLSPISMRYIPVGMEKFGARNAKVWSSIKQQIDYSDLFILIIGHRYGSIDKETGFSYTELEYDYALKQGIPIFAFIQQEENEDNEWNDKNEKNKKKEEDEKNKEKLKKFKEKVKQNRLVVEWINSEDLLTKIIGSINDADDFAGAWIHYSKDDCTFLNQTTVEYGMVNIKVKGTVDECENGQATLTYLGSSIVDSPERIVRYQDRVTATAGIVSQKFTPEAKVLNEEQFRRNSTYLEYELVAPDEDSKLSFTGEIVARQRLSKQKGGIGLHIPYYAKYLIVNINISEAPFIYDYIKLNGRAELIYRNQSEHIEPIFNESSMTYTLVLENAPANSNIAFQWENK